MSVTPSSRLWRRSLNEILRVAGRCCRDDRPGDLHARHHRPVRPADRAPRLPDRLRTSRGSCRCRACRARASPAPPPARTWRATSSRAGSTACSSRPSRAPLLLVGPDPRRDVARDRAGDGSAHRRPADRRRPHRRPRPDRALRGRGRFLPTASLWGRSWRARPHTAGRADDPEGVFLAVFLSTAYTPLVLLHGWLGEVAT